MNDFSRNKKTKTASGRLTAVNPLLGVSPADSPLFVSRAHEKSIFKMATNCDKKREFNGVILSLEDSFVDVFPS